MGPSAGIRNLGAWIVAAVATIALTACFATPADSGRRADLPDRAGGTASTTAPSPVTAPADDERTGRETGYLMFLRTLDPPVALFTNATDDELLQIAQDLCDLAVNGVSADRLMQQWVDSGTNPTDEAIIALFTAADFLYCPGAIDLDVLTASEVWRERLFLQELRATALSFGLANDAAAAEAGRAICDLLAAGSSVDDVVTLLHDNRPLGMAPDPQGARGLIAGSVWAFCPPDG